MDMELCMSTYSHRPQATRKGREMNQETDYPEVGTILEMSGSDIPSSEEIIVGNMTHEELEDRLRRANNSSHNTPVMDCGHLSFWR